MNTTPTPEALRHRPPSTLAICLAAVLAQAGCGGGGAGGAAPAASPPVIASFAIGGTVGGLEAGDTMVLGNNGNDSVLVGSNGPFSFALPVPRSGDFVITVDRQPAHKTCSVAGGMGSGVVADARAAKVSCSATSYAVGGTLAGLGTGRTVRLLANGGNALTLDHNGRFNLSGRVPRGGSVAVTVVNQPVGQVCAPLLGHSGATGVSGDLTDLSILCADAGQRVSGTVSGLSSGEQLTLRNNGGDPLTLTANGPFSFLSPVPTGAGYQVTVDTQPLSQSCEVMQGSGAAGTTEVAGIQVKCAIRKFKVGGTLAGLPFNTRLTLRNEGSDVLVLKDNGPFQFALALPSGGSYGVTVDTQPAGQQCEILDGSGGDVQADVATVFVYCVSSPSLVSGTVGAPGKTP